MLPVYKRSLPELRREFHEFEALLASRAPLKESTDILPFLRMRPHLAASFGFANAYLHMPDRLAQEVTVFGSFRCDVVVGDSRSEQFTLIELEDATQTSVFERASKRAYPRWSSRFEKGFSQLVDWAWRLSHERPPSIVLEPIFGCRNPKIHYLLVVGRQHWLDASAEARLEWRRSHNGIAHQRTSIWTYDTVLDFVPRRLEAADRDVSDMARPAPPR